ncbi:hypothetical protein F5146DRAFT_372467 [Armillaria mellea]|nr:hypothetical protein F5146DRAFT_372467 [Armillaria mellea]
MERNQKHNFLCVFWSLISTALQHLTSLDKCTIKYPTSRSPLGESVMSPLRVLESGFINKASSFSMVLEDVSFSNIEILHIEQSCRNLPEVLQVVPIVSKLTALTFVDNWSFLDVDILKMSENAAGLQSFVLQETRIGRSGHPELQRHCCIDWLRRRF